MLDRRLYLGCWVAILAGLTCIAVARAAEDADVLEISRALRSASSEPLRDPVSDPVKSVSFDEATFATRAAAGGACPTVPDCSSSRCPGFIAHVDWLNLAARRRGLDYASFLNPVYLTPVQTESLEYERDNGVRVGLGYRFTSCWDVSWNYTYFHSGDSGQATAAQNPNLTLVATRSFLDVAATSVQADAGLNYNLHDIEFGRWLELDKRMSVRVLGGFRWAQIDQDQSQRYSYRNIFGASVDGSIQNPTDMDGYGLRFGGEGRWTSPCGLSLFASGAGSVLVGNFRTQFHEVTSADGTIASFSESYTQAVPGIDAAAGAAWRRGGFELSAGYEMTAFFNLAEVGRTSYDLMLDGFFLRLAYVR